MSKLIIVGAGGHGKVVKEIAEDLALFDVIDFVDDNSEIAIGKISDLPKLKDIYDSAFVSIGNNEIRKNLIEHLESIGYKMPCLIHPTAFVSRSTQIGLGTIVEPNAMINSSATVGKGCIISLGVIIDHDCVIGDYCHLNSGSIVKAGSKINNLIKIDAGQVLE